MSIIVVGVEITFNFKYPKEEMVVTITQGCQHQIETIITETQICVMKMVVLVLNFYTEIYLKSRVFSITNSHNDICLFKVKNY